MKNLRAVFLSLLAYFVVSSVCSQGQRRTDPFFFVQITDPQFGFFENNQVFEREKALYEKAVGAINRIKPDFVVITGDFVNDRLNQAQWDEFNRITAKIDSSIPAFFSPGNHDIGQIPASEDIDKYNAIFGYDRFSFRHKKCQFIGINSPILKSGNNNLEQIQFNWLKDALADNKKARHIFIFCHHPFFIKNADEPESYSNIGVDLRSKYLNLFREYKVNAVFTGHLHDNAYSYSGETEMIITSAVGKQLGSAPSGIRIIKVYKDRIEHDYYSLDEIPEPVTFKIRQHKKEMVKVE